MAQIKSRITESGPGKFDDVFLIQIADRYSKRRKQIEEAVRGEIEAVVIANKNLFDPSSNVLGGEDVVGKLGIGNELTRKPDSRKMRNAHILLIPQKGTSTATISTQFQRRASRFGRTTYTINTTNVYKSNIANYTAFSRGRQRVPWLKHFILGLEVPDHAFISSTDGDFVEESSRTGLGHMVPLSDGVVRTQPRQRVGGTRPEPRPSRERISTPASRDRIRIPRQQFAFTGVGEKATFDAILVKVRRRLEQNRFIQRIEQILAAG